jgi:hypothetical protein
MEVNKKRSKLGYLYDYEIKQRIDNGELDAYDIIYTKDSHACYFITPDLNPMRINSKVYCFSSIAEANSALNENEDTYEGQIVSVLKDEVYVGYIVNKNYVGKFYVSPLSAELGDIDYNSLGNKPIINMTGTLDNPIVVDTLSTGIYSINGQYKISNSLETTYLNSSNVLFFIEHSESGTVVKKIDASEIVQYTISDTVLISSYITSDYLKDYATTEYVDLKLAALDYMTQEETETYVESLVTDMINTKIEEMFDESLDEKIDTRIDAKITGIDDQSISDLFV